MRGIVSTAFLVLALAFPAGAQTGIPSLGGGARSGASARQGGLIQGGPGRVASPPSPQPAPPSYIRPGAPDARLGAGSVRPNTGNIVYPGTPGNNQAIGNILSPGLPGAQPIPSLQPIPAVVQPARPAIQGVDPRGGRRRPPIFYPIYGIYTYPLVPNAIAVTGSTVTQSGAGYAIAGGGEPVPERQAETRQKPEPGVVELGDDKLAPSYWLIALQGGLIYAVSDYSIEARALRFTTLQGDAYVVPLAELDADFTVKLNRDRGVEIEQE